MPTPYTTHHCTLISAKGVPEYGALSRILRNDNYVYGSKGFIGAKCFKNLQSSKLHFNI